jgi:hypothetical protein
MEIQMKTRSFIVAVAALSFTTAALATGAAADYTIVTLAKKYSSSQLETICAREGGSSYRMARGTYGCTNGSNGVECQNDGTCRGFLKAPFTLVGAGNSNHRDIGAELVLELPAAPATQ